MYEYSGVGLAAPQVHESLRVFVAMLDPDGRGEGEAVTFINPEITTLGDQTVEGWEGCLSIPEIRGRVPRSQHIKITALDRQGKRFELELKDFPARVVQHETDHLDGVLFLDRMNTFDTLTYLEEYSRYHTRQGDEEDDE
jgi:peptide deformylase